MDTITLTSGGRPTAVAGRDRFWLAAHALPAEHPHRRLVCFTVLYARDILTETLPGPYSDARAERFAIACLIAAELLERPALDIKLAAAAYRIPADALARAHAQKAVSD